MYVTDLIRELPGHAQKYLDKLPEQMVIGGNILLYSTLEIVNYDPYNKFLYLTAPVNGSTDAAFHKFKSEDGARVDYEFNDDCSIVYIRIHFTTAKPIYSKYDPICRPGHVDHNDPEQFFYADLDRYE